MSSKTRLLSALTSLRCASRAENSEPAAKETRATPRRIQPLNLRRSRMDWAALRVIFIEILLQLTDLRLRGVSWPGGNPSCGLDSRLGSSRARPVPPNLIDGDRLVALADCRAVASGDAARVRVRGV